MVLTILTAITDHTSGMAKYSNEDYHQYKDYDFTNKFKFILDHLKVEDAERYESPNRKSSKKKE